MQNFFQLQNYRDKNIAIDIDMLLMVERGIKGEICNSYNGYAKIITNI